ncbi:MAG: pseudouridine-5'-phosphate glycosidase [Pseudomonadota bacterium]
MNGSTHPLLALGDAVAAALAEARPVVALESTLISHGLPAPDNLATARAAETAVREGGATPATVGIVDGRIVVGLDDAQMERLADPESGARKASRRDVAAVLTRRKLAATTVSATMIAAALAGIEVFATGGIGGVHRGAESSFDISADITELARTPVTVVCAGAKLILDLPKTLEVLETAGVPLLGLRCGGFPGFFARDTGLPLDDVVSSVDDLAAIVATQRQLGLATGVLVLNPAPETAAIPADEAYDWIAKAIAEAHAVGVSGKAVTPFLLERVSRLSGGRTLHANKALIVNNAATGARLATALARLKTTLPAPG